jgi:hypothetical protein
LLRRRRRRRRRNIKSICEKNKGFWKIRLQRAEGAAAGKLHNTVSKLTTSWNDFLQLEILDSIFILCIDLRSACITIL